MKLNTSLGQGVAKVPNVQGLDEATARDALDQRRARRARRRRPVQRHRSEGAGDQHRPAGQHPGRQGHHGHALPVARARASHGARCLGPDRGAGARHPPAEGPFRDQPTAPSPTARPATDTCSTRTRSEHAGGQERLPAIIVGRAAPAPATTTTTKARRRRHAGDRPRRRRPAARSRRSPPRTTPAAARRSTATRWPPGRGSCAADRARVGQDRLGMELHALHRRARGGAAP